jgi:hypothetical protein
MPVCGDPSLVSNGIGGRAGDICPTILAPANSGFCNEHDCKAWLTAAGGMGEQLAVSLARLKEIEAERGVTTQTSALEPDVLRYNDRYCNLPTKWGEDRNCNPTEEVGWAEGIGDSTTCSAASVSLMQDGACLLAKLTQAIEGYGEVAPPTGKAGTPPVLSPEAQKGFLENLKDSLFGSDSGVGGAGSLFGGNQSLTRAITLAGVGLIGYAGYRMYIQRAASSARGSTGAGTRSPSTTTLARISAPTTPAPRRPTMPRR